MPHFGISPSLLSYHMAILETGVGLHTNLEFLTITARQGMHFVETTPLVIDAWPYHCGVELLFDPHDERVSYEAEGWRTWHQYVLACNFGSVGRFFSQSEQGKLLLPSLQNGTLTFPMLLRGYNRHITSWEGWRNPTSSEDDRRKRVEAWKDNLRIFKVLWRMVENGEFSRGK
jgi:hypothetical protein